MGGLLRLGLKLPRECFSLCSHGVLLGVDLIPIVERNVSRSTGCSIVALAGQLGCRVSWGRSGLDLTRIQTRVRVAPPFRPRYRSVGDRGNPLYEAAGPCL